MKEATLYIVFIGSLLCFDCKGQDPNNNTNKSSTITPSEKAIKSMLPPQLSYPANESVIDIQYPVLIWIPPVPTNGMAVTYNLRLVEISNGQTLAEALLQNPPLINLSGLSNTFLNYPVDATPLEPNEHYAWQVSASYAGQSLGITDIWTFTVKPPPPPPTDGIIYPVASNASDGHFYVTKGIMRFAYTNKANDKKLNYVIKRLSKQENLKSLPVLMINAGTNKLEVDLRHNAGMNQKEYYELEITDGTGQMYKVLFYYVTS